MNIKINHTLLSNLFNLSNLSNFLKLFVSLSLILPYPTIFAKNSQNQNQYSKKFSIQILNPNAKLVTDGAKQQFLLVKSSKNIPKQFLNHPQIQIVQTPIQRVLVGSTTHAAQLRAIQELDSIIAVTTHQKDWTIPQIKQNIQAQKIHFIGNSYQPNWEMIKKINPNFAIVYTGKYPQTPLIQALKKLNIPYIVNNAYEEPSVLARLEWIRLMATFYNKESTFENYFQNVKNKLKSIKNYIKKNYPSQNLRVGWATFYKGDIYIPNSGSYIADMIRKASGTYAFQNIGQNQTGSSRITLEKFYQQSFSLNILILGTDSQNQKLQQILTHKPILKNINVFRKPIIWNPNKKIWYQSMDKTHQQIQDLARIIWNFQKNQIVYFHKILP